jgi:hypothetical protein
MGAIIRRCEGCGKELDAAVFCMFCRKEGKPCGLHKALRRHPSCRHCGPRCRRLAKKRGAGDATS